MRAKFYWTVILCGIFTLLIVLFRPHNPRIAGIPDEVIDAYKLNFHKEADLVFMGDSRTETNISTSDVVESLPDGWEVRNCGFSAQGLSESFLRYALDSFRHSPKKQRYLALSISDSNLHRELPNLPFHIDFDKRPRYVLPLWINYYFAAVNVDEIKLLCGIQPTILKVKANHIHGWREIKVSDRQASYAVDGNPLYSAEDAAREYEEGLVMLQNLIRQARMHSIEVIVWMPPVGEGGRERQRITKFDPQKVEAAVKEAGGIFLQIPLTDFYSYDGSHLESESARRLSRNWGKAFRTDVLME